MARQCPRCDCECDRAPPTPSTGLHSGRCGRYRRNARVWFAGDLLAATLRMRSADTDLFTDVWEPIQKSSVKTIWQGSMRYLEHGAGLFSKASLRRVCEQAHLRLGQPNHSHMRASSRGTFLASTMRPS